MSANPQVTYLSPEAYLEAELTSSVKHEYQNGQIYAMVGGSDEHVRISVNLVSVLNGHLRGSGCLVYSSDMKVHIERLNLYYYPDALMTCDDRDPCGICEAARASRYFKQFPKLIVEVLSPTTEAFDRGDKFDDYQHLDSLEEYVLISQSRMRVECFRRNVEGLWVRYVYRKGDEFEFASVDYKGAIADLYENVEFDSAIDPPG